jgi:hypothetical protein
MKKPQKMVQIRVPLTCPPPNRCSVENGDGTYYTRPWLPDEKKKYVEANMKTVWVPVKS